MILSKRRKLENMNVYSTITPNSSAEQKLSAATALAENYFIYKLTEKTHAFIYK